MATNLSSPVSPRDLALKEKRFQSIDDIENAYNIMVRRLNDVYKYNRRDHDRLTEDVAESPACKAYRAAGNVTVPNGGTPTLFTIDTALYDPSSMLDAANSKIIVPSDGYYLVIAKLHWTTQPGGGTTEVGINKNGTQYADKNYGADGSIYQPIAADIISCVEDDEITMTAYQTSGVSRTASGGGITYLSVAKM